MKNNGKKAIIMIVFLSVTLFGCGKATDNTDSNNTLDNKIEIVEAVSESVDNGEEIIELEESMQSNRETSEIIKDGEGELAEEMKVYQAVVNDTANVRAGASVDDERIGTVKKGAIVTVLEQMGDWCLVLWNDQEVYIMSQYLDEATEEELNEIAPEKPQEQSVGTSDSNDVVPETEEVVQNDVNPSLNDSTVPDYNFTIPSGENTSVETTVVSPYTFEARVLNACPIYSKSRVVIYIKTNHPDGNKMFVSSGNMPSQVILGMYYNDIKYVDKDNIYTSFEKVNEGYVCVVSPQNSGNYTYTFTDASIPGNSLKMGSIDIVVNDRTVAENVFYENVIQSVTTPEMTDKQKMDEICEYVRNNFKYKQSGPDGTVIFLTSLEGPWVDNRRIHCDEATGIMMEFARRLGLQSECTYAGYASHVYATVTIDGIPYVYDACPLGETGIVTSWDYVL